MIRKMFFFLIASIVFNISPLFSQWAKVYGKEGLHFQACRILNSHGGDYIAAGIYLDNADSHVRWSGWIMKVSKNGGLKWMRQYSPVLEMAITSDKGYVGVGWDTIFKIDSAGNLVWHKKVKIDRFESIEETIDAGLISVGTLHDRNKGDAHCIIKFSHDGKIEWSKKFAIENLSHPNLRIKPTPDGGYIAVGNTKLPRPYPKGFWIMKINSKGKIDWQKRFGGMVSHLVRDFAITSRNEYLLMGSHEAVLSDISYANVWLMKISSNGKIAWQKKYIQVDGHGYGIGSSIIKAQDGGYLITGRASHKIDFEIMALKLNKNGAIEWFKTFGGTNGNSVTDIENEANSACQVKKGRFIVIGSTNALGMDWHKPESPRQNSIVLLKLKKNGRLKNCPLLEDGPLLIKVRTSYPLVDYSYALRPLYLKAKNTALEVKDIDVEVIDDICSWIYQ